MERFTGADRLPPEEAAIREAERLGPILSLLVLLDRCESISVIVGDTSLRSRLDVGKIARFVESPPRPTPKHVWRQIAILRSACLGEDFTDPASDEARKALTPPDDDRRHDMWLWSIRDTEPRVQEAIALLLKSPTTAKVNAASTILRFGREGIELDDLAARVQALEEVAEAKGPRP